MMAAVAVVVRNANVPANGIARVIGGKKRNNEKWSWMRERQIRQQMQDFGVTDLGQNTMAFVAFYGAKRTTLPRPDGDGPASSNSFAFDTKDRALSKPQSVDIKLAFGFAPSGRIPAF
jgi:hypothetical protein